MTMCRPASKSTLGQAATLRVLAALNGRLGVHKRLIPTGRPRRRSVGISCRD
jgi:hypothetical protein